MSRTIEDYSERYWKLKNQIKKELPYCWNKDQCRYRVLHRCNLLKETERGECKFFRSI